MKNMPVLIPMRWPGIIKLGLLQLNRLSDQPAAEPMPDHQDALPQEKTGIVDFALNPGNQLRIVLADFQFHRYHGLKQTGKPEGLAVHRFQVRAVHDQRAHGCKRSGPGPSRAKPHELVAHPVPEHLHQMAELIAAYPGHLNTQQIRRNTGLPEHFSGIKTKRFGAHQGGLNKVP